MRFSTFSCSLLSLDRPQLYGLPRVEMSDDYAGFDAIACYPSGPRPDREGIKTTVLRERRVQRRTAAVRGLPSAPIRPASQALLAECKLPSLQHGGTMWYNHVSGFRVQC